MTSLLQLQQLAAAFVHPVLPPATAWLGAGTARPRRSIPRGIGPSVGLQQIAPPEGLSGGSCLWKARSKSLSLLFLVRILAWRSFEAGMGFYFSPHGPRHAASPECAGNGKRCGCGVPNLWLHGARMGGRQELSMETFISPVLPRLA